MKGTNIVIMPMKEDIQSLRRPRRSAIRAPAMEERRLTMFRPPFIAVLMRMLVVCSLCKCQVSDICAVMLA